MRDVADLIDKLRAIRDPVARWRQVSRTEVRLREEQGWLAAVRTEIVLEMRGAGLSLRQVADQLGVSKSRVAVIEKQRQA
jgi:predicted XRE-type DNA-binding protein